MEQSLIDKFTPIFILHPKEQYYPCSIEWLVSHSTYQCSTGDQKSRTSECTGSWDTSLPVNNETMHNLSIDKATGDSTLWFEYSDSYYKGESELTNVPTYAHVQKDESFTYISYTCLYAYNGPKKVLGCIPVGAHCGDLEHVTVKINKEGEIESVFFGAHTKLEGRWVLNKDLEKDANGKPIVYIAINSHACYPYSGTIIRFGGFGNDNTSSKGVRWIPKAVQVFGKNEELYEINKHGWVSFCGRVGFDGVSSLSDKDYFYGKDPEQKDCKSPCIWKH